jgi:hypothetical protein
MKHLTQNIPGANGMKLALPHFPDSAFQAKHSYRVLQHRGWIVGARHLMEFPARVSEIFKGVYDRTAAGQREIDISGSLAGIYGVAFDIFCEYCENNERGQNALIAAAVACDLALNVAYPPLAPAFLYSPSEQFAQISIALRDFDLSRQVPINDPAIILQLIEDIYQHLEKRVGFDVRVIPKSLSRLFGHLNVEEVVGEILGQEGAAQTHNASLRWYASLWAESSKIRIETPEFFPAPFSVYLRDREIFHHLYDRVASPLLKLNGSMRASREETNSPEWWSFSQQLAIQADLHRGIMYCTADELAHVLARHVQYFAPRSPEAEYQAQLLFGSVLKLVNGAQVGVSLVRRTARVLGCESPV